MPDIDPAEAAHDLLAAANAHATTALLMEIAERLGVREIDGVSLNDWHQQRKLALVNHRLSELTPKMPEVVEQMRVVLESSLADSRASQNS